MLSPNSRKEALRRDDQDPLARFRDHFAFPTDDDGEPLIYFCGNSLGLQPQGARQKVAREMDDWSERAVAGHFEGDTPWVSFNERLEGPVADLVGASTDEIALSNTLTANLHLMMVSFYRPTADRYKILVEGGAFPSDQYAVKSQADFHGFDPDEAIVEVEPREGEDTLRTEDIVAKIDELGDQLALTMFTGVHYYTGQAFDLPTITEAAHDVGAFAGFDLAHAVGNVPLELHDSGADFAVWCHYKYMNAGPGAVGGYFVHDRHADSDDIPRFEGWWGNDPETRFEMKPEFEPQHGAGAWQLSNAPVLSLAPLDASLELFQEAGMEQIRQKSLDLGDYLLELLDQIDDKPFEIITPTDHARRGSQFSLRGPEGTRDLYETLRASGVVCDYRNPRVIRLAPAPLYNSFEDVWTFCRILANALD